MTPWLTKLAHESNGRPFTSEEIYRISQYAETLPELLAAVKKLEENQKWLVRHLADWVTPRAVEWGLPKDPFTTDFAGFLAAIGQALLCEDVALLDATVVAPCASLAAALEVPAGEFAELFDEGWRVLTPRLDPAAERLLAPFFARAAACLRGDQRPTLPTTQTEPTPEPVSDLVGV